MESQHLNLSKSNETNSVIEYGYKNEKLEKLIAPQAAPRDYEIVMQNFFIIGYLHLAALYGIYLCFTSTKWQTILFAYTCYVFATIGVTAGAHRLWSHRCYKAKMPLQAILIIFLSMANQRATHWVRDHRLHHKYSDTDADPHNAARGFIYSHIGWLFVRKHPEVIKRGKQINLSDLFNNPVVNFQHNCVDINMFINAMTTARTFNSNQEFLIAKFQNTLPVYLNIELNQIWLCGRYAKYFTNTFCFILPTLIPAYFWGETISNSWNVNIMRYVFNFHMFFLVNSVAHLWGNKPYEKNIQSVENRFVSLATLGEGFHNYHHVFPYDYKSSELGNLTLNYTTTFIDFFSWIGWAYDLKTVSKETIENRAEKSGDGSWKPKS